VRPSSRFSRVTSGVRTLPHRARDVPRVDLGDHAGQSVPLGGVRRHQDDAVDAEVERRLDRRIEPRAADEEPVRVRLPADPDGAEEDR
jgi:hypothetical protein